MNTKVIYTNNADFQKIEVLKRNRNKRYQYKQFLVEGVKNIKEAIKREWEIISFIYEHQGPLSHWAQETIKQVKTECNYELVSDLMVLLSGKEDTSEILALVRMKDEGLEDFSLTENPIIVIFDRPSNKGNLGTIIRSCDALGIHGMLMTGHAVDLYDPEVINATMGSFFKIPVYRPKSHQEISLFIDKLRQTYTNLQVIGTTAHSQVPIYEIDCSGPVIFLLGNETDGLSYKLSMLADEMTTIPMAQDACATSFNVGCAATVLFYEAMRQRQPRFNSHI